MILRLLLAPLLVLFALLAPACDSIHKEPGLFELITGQPDVELKVMSFNVRYGTAKDGPNDWDHRRALFMELLRTAEPDIIGLQEALRFQLDEIRTELPNYAEIGVGRDDGKTAGEYAAILYRRDKFSVLSAKTFWLSDTPDVPGSKSWGNHVARVCTFALLRDRKTQRQFYFFNTHMDHESEPARVKGAELIAKSIENTRMPGVPVIFSGDLNATPDSVAVRYLTGRPGDAPAPRGEGRSLLNLRGPGFIDTYVAANPSAKPQESGTFHDFKCNFDGRRIDYILVEPGMTTLEAAIDHTVREGRGASDHWAITARIRLPKGGLGQ